MSNCCFHMYKNLRQDGNVGFRNVWKILETKMIGCCCTSHLWEIFQERHWFVFLRWKCWICPGTPGSEEEIFIYSPNTSTLLALWGSFICLTASFQRRTAWHWVRTCPGLPPRRRTSSCMIFTHVCDLIFFSWGAFTLAVSGGFGFV